MATVGNDLLDLWELELLFADGKSEWISNAEGI